MKKGAAYVLIFHGRASVHVRSAVPTLQAGRDAPSVSVVLVEALVRVGRTDCGMGPRRALRECGPGLRRALGERLSPIRSEWRRSVAMGKLGGGGDQLPDRPAHQVAPGDQRV